MSVTMICPNLKCGSTVVAPDNARGRLVRCVQCQTLFMVPRGTVVATIEPEKPPAENAAPKPAAAPANSKKRPRR